MFATCRYALPLLLLAGPAQAADWEPGEVITDAAAFDLTEAGFEALAEILPTLVPADPIELGSMSEAGGSADWCLNYEFSTSNMWVAMEVTEAVITPGAGVLDVDMDLLIWINDSSDPFEMYTELFCAGDTCYGRVEPFSATVSTTIALEVVNPSTPEAYLDATVETPTIAYDLTSDNIVLEDCAIGTVETILNYLGLSMYDLILSTAAGSIEGALADSEEQIATLRSALEAPGGPPDALRVQPWRNAFMEAMDDDFDTPRAIGVLGEIARGVLDGRLHGETAVPTLRELGGVLGLALDARCER